MKDEYCKIKVDSISESNIDGIIKVLKKYPDLKLFVNVKNTKYINEDCLYKLVGYKNMYIRVEGGYDDDRLRNYTKLKYLNIHKFDNIYTVSELIIIIGEMKKIEEEIRPDWSSEQKLLYFISFLQDRLVYSTDNISNSSNIIRSLRGLYARKTVCAGFSMILKELCDRNGIECDYVEGCCDSKIAEIGLLTHAWNIVRINGNYFPIDLTFNANNYIRGENRCITNLCNAPQFIINHIPGKYEKLQDYKNNLKSMDGTFIRKILDTINQNKFFESTKFYGKRKDGSKYIIYQIDDKLLNGKSIYKYVYCDLLYGNSLGLPVILYSGTNISEFLYNNDKNSSSFDKSKILVDELFLSKNNIIQAIKKRNNYIGSIVCPKGDNYRVIIELKIAKLFKDKKFKTFKRKDGSNFAVELVDGYPTNVNDHKIYCYNVFEYFADSDNIKLKSNRVYTDFDIFLVEHNLIANTYLDRKRIDEKVKSCGGYLGFYSGNKRSYAYDNLDTYFSLSKRIEMTNSDVLDLYTKLSFQEMKELVMTYKIIRDNNGNMLVYERKNNKLIDDSELCIKVKFASLWVYSMCGENVMNGEIINIAFSELNENLFTDLCLIIDDYLFKTGNIDTVGILLYLKSLYPKYSSDMIYNVITKLFSTDETNEIINQYFRLVNPSAIVQTEKMEKLSDIKTAKRKVEDYRRKLLALRDGSLEVVKGKKGAIIKKYKNL